MRRVTEKKNTGDYVIELVDHGSTGEEYVLRVNYVGPWSSGEPVELVSLDLTDELDRELGDDWGYPETCEEADSIARKWFESIRGDHDVVGYLANHGFDRYTNR